MDENVRKSRGAKEEKAQKDPQATWGAGCACVCATCFVIEHMWHKQLHFIYSNLPSSHLQTH